MWGKIDMYIHTHTLTVLMGKTGRKGTLERLGRSTKGTEGQGLV